MVQPLEGKGDYYDGVLVDLSTGSADDAACFSERLQLSLEEWHAAERKGIWIKIPLSCSALVPVAACQGFAFHHAEPGYVMMCRWLPATESKLPASASHQIGVGAFVLNENREVLMVQERNGVLKGRGVWKMPTGLLDRGEDVGEGAAREVAEETGVRSSFQSVIALRQAHGFLHGNSDLFFCVACTPEPGQRELRIQEDEVEAACWMPLADFASNPFTAGHPIFSKITAQCVAFAEGRYAGLTGHKLESSAFGLNKRLDLLLIAEDVTASSMPAPTAAPAAVIST